MYDICFQFDNNEEEFLRIKSRFPTVKKVASLGEAIRKSFTKMLWFIPSNAIVSDDFTFEYTADILLPNVFLNGNNYNGIILLPKKVKLSLEELDTLIFREWVTIDIVASTPRQYDIFFLRKTEEEDIHVSLAKKLYRSVQQVKTYEEALATCSTDMCWVVPDKFIPAPNFKFDYNVDRWDLQFKHEFKTSKDNLGVVLLPKDTIISKHEKEYNCFYRSKQIPVESVVEYPDDVFFISYNETNADANYERLLSIVPYAKRVDGVKGIHAAHKVAAEKSLTKMFWVVDGDAYVVDGFKFEHAIYKWDFDSVYVWRSKNPINGLEYGYGGAKLLPRAQTLASDNKTVDMTTAISSKFNVMDEVSNVTAFNTDAFSTWRSAFRECAKLSSSIINNTITEETQHRLQVWCTVNNGAEFGKWALIGANAGKEFGEANATDLHKINDYEWLHEQFSKYTVE